MSNLLFFSRKQDQKNSVVKLECFKSQEQEMAKQKLLSEQSRLKDRGAAEMILLLITKCNGEQSEVAEVTLQLGISVLAGGNVDVQTVGIEPNQKY